MRCNPLAGLRVAALALTVLSIAALSTAGPAQPAPADLDRQADAVVAAMEALPPSGFTFDARINDGDAGVLAVGSDVVFHLRSEKPAYVTLVYLDQDAVVSLPIPTGSADAGRIARAGAPYVVSCDGVIPGTRPEDGCGFEAFFPLGFDVVWAIATESPLPVRDLGGPWNVDAGLDRLRPADGPAFAQALVAHLRALPAGQVAWQRLEQAVLELGEGNPEVLNEYVRNRSMRNPLSNQRYRMPSIFFASRSAALDARAERALDTVARALLHPDHANARIRLVGHADAIGPSEDNADLSRRRAESARRHLEAAGIAPARIEVVARGESDPLSPGSDRVAHQRNRRVEIDIRP